VIGSCDWLRGSALRERYGQPQRQSMAVQESAPQQALAPWLHLRPASGEVELFSTSRENKNFRPRARPKGRHNRLGQMLCSSGGGINGSSDCDPAVAADLACSPNACNANHAATGSVPKRLALSLHLAPAQLEGAQDLQLGSSFIGARRRPWSCAKSNGPCATNKPINANTDVGRAAQQQRAFNSCEAAWSYLAQQRRNSLCGQYFARHQDESFSGSSGGTTRLVA
jgi:hypothetical protein